MKNTPQKSMILRATGFGVLVAAAGLLAPQPRVFAANVSLINTGDYLVGANWNNGGLLPGASDNAFISSGRTATLAGSAPTVGLAFTINSGGTLVLNAGADLTVTGVTQLFSSTTSGFVTQNGGSFTASTLSIGGGVSGTPATTTPALYTINGGTLTASTINVTPNTSRGSLAVTGGAVNASTLTVGNNGGSGDLNISGGVVTVSGIFQMNGAGGTNIGTSNVSVSGGTLTLNPGSTFNIATTLNSPNAKSLAVSGSGVVNLGGRTTTWANGGATQEYGVVTVSGGELNFQNATVTLGNSSTFTGGKVTGLSSLANAMTINGSEFHVGSNTAAASTTSLVNTASTAFTLTSGSLILGAYGDNNADLFSKGSLSTADLAGGSIVVDFNYIPSIGDSFNFIDWSGSINLTTANISSTSYDGNYLIDWNTDNWVGSGILSINNITVVPEPRAIVLLAGSLLFLMTVRRRRSQMDECRLSM